MMFKRTDQFHNRQTGVDSSSYRLSGAQLTFSVFEYGDSIVGFSFMEKTGDQVLLYQWDDDDGEKCRRHAAALGGEGSSYVECDPLNHYDAYIDHLTTGKGDIPNEIADRIVGMLRAFADHRNRSKRG